MLGWVSFFFVTAFVAALCGFGGVAASGAGSAKAVFVVYLVLGVVSLISERRGTLAR